jgi:hypothetical protein
MVAPFLPCEPEEWHKYVKIEGGYIHRACLLPGEPYTEIPGALYWRPE